MLYIFKSEVTGNLIMLQPSAERLLQIIGKDTSARGILLPEQLGAAIAALESALAREDAELKATAQSAHAEPAPRADVISLRQRAAPFIDMLRRCHKAGKEIVWGV